MIAYLSMEKHIFQILSKNIFISDEQELNKINDQLLIFGWTIPLQFSLTYTES